MTIEIQDPDGDVSLQNQLRQAYGFQPLSLGLFSDQQFWSFIVVEREGRAIPAPLLPEFILAQTNNDTSATISAGDIQQLVENFIQRLTPGFRRKIGIVTRVSESQSPGIPGMSQQGPRRDYTELEKALIQNYDVELLDLDKTGVPTGIDALIVGKTNALSEKAKYGIDQYLMLGGSVIALASAYEGVPGMGGWTLEQLDDSLLDMLKTYGVSVGTELILDPQNFDFPYPIEEQRGPYVVRRVEQIDYPYFPLVTTTGYEDGNLIFKGIKELIFPWSNPVYLNAKEDGIGDDILDEMGLPEIALPEGVTGSYLAWTTEQAWTDPSTSVSPNRCRQRQMVCKTRWSQCKTGASCGCPTG